MQTKEKTFNITNSRRFINEIFFYPLFLILPVDQVSNVVLNFIVVPIMHYHRGISKFLFVKYNLHINNEEVTQSSKGLI